MPADLLRILEEVPEQRLILGYAELNVYLPLVYPKELMKDTIPPVITDVSVLNVTSNSAAITWLTDEFADSVVNYGVSATVYTATSTDNLYVKEHGIALAGLSSGTTYYFVVKSADRSGNSAVSLEYTFTTEG
jgi:chitodextrinase